MSAMTWWKLVEEKKKRIEGRGGGSNCVLDDDIRIIDSNVVNVHRTSKIIITGEIAILLSTHCTVRCNRADIAVRV